MANPLTAYDVLKVVAGVHGIFGAFILGTIFFWLRHVKTDMSKRYTEVKDDMKNRYSIFKDDMREMIRGMHESFEKRYTEKYSDIQTRISKNEACILYLKEKYNEHYERYHSRKE